MIDADNGLRVHWMIVNIVGTDWESSGATIAEYNAPTPLKVQYCHAFSRGKINFPVFLGHNTRYLSQFRAKLRDWAVRPVRAGCYPRAALSLLDSKTLYVSKR